MKSSTGQRMWVRASARKNPGQSVEKQSSSSKRKKRPADSISSSKKHKKKNGEASARTQSAAEDETRDTELAEETLSPKTRFLEACYDWWLSYEDSGVKRELASP